MAKGQRTGFVGNLARERKVGVDFKFISGRIACWYHRFCR